MEEIVNKIIETTTTVTEKITELKDNIWDDEQKLIVEEFKDKGMDRLKEIISDFNNSSALFESAGFKQESITVSMGLPPDISSKFKMISKVSSDEQKKLLTQTEDNKILKVVLSCLFKANNFCDMIQLGDFKLDSVNIKLGLIPGITVNLTK
jgi:hypothetical protein